MQVITTTEAALSQRLAAELGAAPAPSNVAEPPMPGLIVSLKDLALSAPAHGPAPLLLVSPQQSAWLFDHQAEASLLKAVYGLVSDQIDRRWKAGIDALWLVYKAELIREELQRPDYDEKLVLFKLAGLGQGVAGLVGNLIPDLRMTDAWANGINLVIKSGGALYEGKTPPVADLLLPGVKPIEIVTKALACAGLSLDPRAATTPVRADPTVPSHPTLRSDDRRA